MHYRALFEFINDDHTFFPLAMKQMKTKVKCKVKCFPVCMSVCVLNWQTRWLWILNHWKCYLNVTWLAIISDYNISRCPAYLQELQNVAASYFHAKEALALPECVRHPSRLHSQLSTLLPDYQKWIEDVRLFIYLFIHSFRLFMFCLCIFRLLNHPDPHQQAWPHRLPLVSPPANSLWLKHPVNLLILVSDEGVWSTRPTNRMPHSRTPKGRRGSRRCL